MNIRRVTLKCLHAPQKKTKVCINSTQHVHVSCAEKRHDEQYLMKSRKGTNGAELAKCEPK